MPDRPVSIFICGRPRRRCRTPGCGNTAVALCDYPVTRKGKVTTCNAGMCDRHRRAVGPDSDYCPPHAKLADAEAERAADLAGAGDPPAAAQLPAWVAEHCDGVPPTDPDALAWMRARPVGLRPLMMQFPPSCVVRIKTTGTLAILASWWEGDAGKPSGIGLRRHDSGHRHACHAEHVDVVAYWHGCTPDWVRDVLAVMTGPLSVA